MANSAGEPVVSEKPTRVRYGVLGFAFALAMITYLDRASLASAKTDIVHDLGLKSVADLGCAFAAFSLAYALFEVPSGWLGDTFGPRRVLIRIGLWWSVFIALTGMVGLKVGGTTLGGLGLLVVIQFLFGAGEAGAFPNITRALHNWFPTQQRGFAQGAVWMCGRMMGGLTPLIWMFLMGGLHRVAPGPASEAARAAALAVADCLPAGRAGGRRVVPVLRPVVPRSPRAEVGRQRGRAWPGSAPGGHPPRPDTPASPGSASSRTATCGCYV